VGDLLFSVVYGLREGRALAWECDTVKAFTVATIEAQCDSEAIEAA
jgi:hypothetical protein